MRNLVFLLLIIFLLSACETSDGNPYEASATTSCTVEPKPNNIVEASCEPERITVTQQANHKIREAYVSMVYVRKTTAAIKDSDAEKVAMVIMTTSDDWNFLNAERASVHIGPRTNASRFHVFKFEKGEKVDREHHAQTNYISLTSEKAIEIAKSDEVLVAIKKARLDASPVSDQMDMITKKLAQYANY